MAPITRGASKNKAANKPTPAALKIKLTPGKIQSAIQLSATEKDGEVIEKVAALEAQLRDKREAELQEALTLPMPLEQAAAESPPLELPTSGAEDYSSHCNNVRREEGGALMEETPLFLSDAADDQFSRIAGEQEQWETEPEWTGFNNHKIVSVSKDDVDMVDEPSPATAKPVAQQKLKARPKKPLMIRDLVKAQISVDNESDTPGAKKRKPTSDGDRPVTKRTISKPSIKNADNGLTIRPGFLEDDDEETVEHERKAVKGQRGKSSKSVVKVTHENTPPTAEEKRKKSSIPSHYLKDFDTKLMPELIKRVSDDQNPWQPTFDANSVIEEIRRQVYPNIKERFENKDPLLAPAFNKVTNWRAAIGRRAMGVVNAYFGDESVFKKTEEIEEHVQWLLPNKDEGTDEEADEDDEEDDVDVEEIVRRRKRKFVGAPFLYENGLIGPAKEAPSGYLLSPLVLKTFAIHFDTTGINADPITCKSQVGALALVLTAVERAISCWETGKEKKPSKAFSQVECGTTTEEYIEALDQVPAGHWELVLSSTRQYTPWKQDVVKPEKKLGARARVPAGL